MDENWWIDLLRSSTARRVLSGLHSISLLHLEIFHQMSAWMKEKTVSLIILISLKHEASICPSAGRDAGAKIDTVSVSQYFLKPYTVWSIPIRPSILNIPWIIDDSSTNTHKHTNSKSNTYTHTETHWFRILCVCVHISEYIFYHVLLPSTHRHTHTHTHTYTTAEVFQIVAETLFK